MSDEHVRREAEIWEVDWERFEMGVDSLVDLCEHDLEFWEAVVIDFSKFMFVKERDKEPECFLLGRLKLEKDCSSEIVHPLNIACFRIVVGKCV